MLNGTGQHPDDAREAALLMNIAGLGGSGGMKNGSANTGGNGPAAGAKPPTVTKGVMPLLTKRRGVTTTPSEGKDTGRHQLV